MPRKKVDPRIKTLIENGVKTRHRSFLVLVGDRGRDQIVNLHYVLSKSQVKSRPSVLWCYKRDLGFSTHKQKRMKQVKKLIRKGLYDPDKDNPFDLFISSTDIRYCYYRDSHKILGNTYGMLILQDFEAVTPNLLCRTIETIEGGGLVILLLRTMSSLRQLYRMSMDVHSRFRSSSAGDVVARFNERFLLSLGTCSNCIVADDELNVLPISKHAKAIKAVPAPEEGEAATPEQKELQELKASLADTQPVGSLVALAKTLDQARAVLTFQEAVAEKTLRSTVALTAGRGRGKSAALGLAIAGAVAHGYSNIFLTSPSPENLTTLFEFVFKGLDALGYTEHADYEAVQSTNPDFNRAVVRINLFRSHRQSVAYVEPGDAVKVSQAELVVIDEAAAIPLPLVRSLIGPYLVFMSSTVNGYEGTGRSLSMKLISDLRKAQRRGGGGGAGSSQRGTGHGSGGAAARVLREIELAEPIRYAPRDPVEQWLNDLLCLDATSKPYKLTCGCPLPSACDLFYVNRDSLFSFHKLSEAFLQRVMSLYVASHYKNTPNDLQLLSDAPAQQLFVLLAPPDAAREGAGTDNPADALPDVLCVVQVALEGQISKEHVKKSLAKGMRPSGDLIPWTIAQQFQDNGFASLSGARIVRIAAHPSVNKMGYGTRALELLAKYFSGDITNLDEAKAATREAEAPVAAPTPEVPAEGAPSQLLSEKIKPRKKLGPLLMGLAERAPERLHWIGTSFGLTQPLFNFWSKSQYKAVYLRQTANDLTGEHTVVMLRELPCADLAESPDPDWLLGFTRDFQRRFLALLGFQFGKFHSSMAMTLAGASKGKGGAKAQNGAEASAKPALTGRELELFASPDDVARLEAYARNMVDYHMIMDLIPGLARLYFLGKLPDVSLSAVQTVLLLGQGLQHKTIDALEAEMNVEGRQLLALFNKAMRKMVRSLRGILERDAEQEMAPALQAAQAAQAGRAMAPVAQTLAQDLDEGGSSARKQLSAQQQAVLSGVDLEEYAVGGDDRAWAEALSGRGATGVVSVRNSAKTKSRREETTTAVQAAAEEAAKSGELSGRTTKPKSKGKGGKDRKRSSARGGGGGGGGGGGTPAAKRKRKA